jgi:uncharacterized protein YlxW (UPF0749 family)
MGITGSAYLYHWCPMTDEIHNVEHTYMPVNQRSDDANELLRQQLCTVQSDMKQLVNRIEHTEHKIASFAQQLAEMADTDMVIIRS